MKDVVRYLETGELGRLASKPKDKNSLDEHDSENDKDDVSLLIIGLSKFICLCTRVINCARASIYGFLWFIYLT